MKQAILFFSMVSVIIALTSCSSKNQGEVSADDLIVRENWKRAEAILEQALEHAKALDRVVLLNKLALVEENRGKPSEAVKLARESVSLARVRGTDNQFYIRSSLVLASALKSNDQSDEARSIIHRALKFAKAHRKESPQLLIDVLSEMGEADGTELGPEAESAAISAAKLTAELYGTDSLQYAAALIEKQCFTTATRTQDLSTALKIRQAKLGEEHPLVAEVLLFMSSDCVQYDKNGQVHETDYAKQAALNERMIRIFEKEYGEGDQRLPDRYITLALDYEKLGRKAEAAATRMKAVACYETAIKDAESDNTVSSLMIGQFVELLESMHLPVPEKLRKTRDTLAKAETDRQQNDQSISQEDSDSEVESEDTATSDSSDETGDPNAPREEFANTLDIKREADVSVLWFHDWKVTVDGYKEGELLWSELVCSVPTQVCNVETPAPNIIKVNWRDGDWVVWHPATYMWDGYHVKSGKEEPIQDYNKMILDKQIEEMVSGNFSDEDGVDVPGTYIDEGLIKATLTRGHTASMHVFRQQPHQAAAAADIMRSCCCLLIAMMKDDLREQMPANKTELEKLSLLFNKYNVPKTLWIPAINDYAFFLAESGENEEALPLLQYVLKEDPARTCAYLNMGDALMALGKKKEALANYQIFCRQTSAKNKPIPARLQKLLQK